LFEEEARPFVEEFLHLETRTVQEWVSLQANEGEQVVGLEH
jgi:hypothetical protein